jgi:hypothetical protein
MPTRKILWRNRKERKEWARRLQSEDPGLEVVHPHAAGIDVGNSAHYVALRPDRDPEQINGWVYHSPLPSFRWSHCKQQGLFAPRTLLRFPATTGPSATLSSSTAFLVSPVIRFPAPSISRRDG